VPGALAWEKSRERSPTLVAGLSVARDPTREPDQVANSLDEQDGAP